MMWIGLTGGIASGKSTVAGLIKAQGWPVVDADLIAKEVVQKGSEGIGKVVQAFGPQVLGPDGELIRKELGKIVFANPKKLELLESIIHPLVQKRVGEYRKQYMDQGLAVAFYDVPLLFEKKLEKQFDKILVVSSSGALQRERMKKRDQLSADEIEARLKSQLPISEKEKKADWVITNNGDAIALEKSVQEFAVKLKKMVSQL